MAFIFFEGVILKVELFQLMSIYWLVTHKAIHFILKKISILNVF